MKKKGAARCVCGGGPAHHTVEPECWCPSCLRLPEAERCTEYRPVEQPVVERQVAPVGARHPGTAQAAARAELPRTGSKRRALYDWIIRKHGCTDDELEQITGWSHQSVSAARNTLMEDGLIVDGGDRRLTQHGHDAIVWVVAR